MALEQRKKLM
ncbi:hypothetical protein EC80586_5002, partial [Escherichia coli 8.0586]